MSRGKGKVKNSTQVSSFRREDDEVFELNDAVMVNPESKGAKPYIGKIKDMVKQKKNSNEVLVLFQWYYRPEESSGGRKKLRDVEDSDFFSRFKYKPSTREFKPDKVPVFCICEMPYNPDKFMVMCDDCEEWYHPECIGQVPEKMKSMQRFVCEQCRSSRPMAEDPKR